MTGEELMAKLAQLTVEQRQLKVSCCCYHYGDEMEGMVYSSPNNISITVADYDNIHVILLEE